MNLNGNGHAPKFSELIIPGLDDSAYTSLLLRLDCYDSFILAQRFENGQPGLISSVDPLDVAAAMSGVPLTSPLLPKGCLFWQRAGSVEKLAVYIDPAVWTVNVSGNKRMLLRVSMPGLVWFGVGAEYRLYAVKEYPAAKDTQLFKAPVPNMSDNICQGNVKFPTAACDTILHALGLFFESDFNSHLSNGKSKAYPREVLEMWKKLHEAEAKEYPLDDLESAGLSLGQLMEVKQ